MLESDADGPSEGRTRKAPAVLARTSPDLGATPLRAHRVRRLSAARRAALAVPLAFAALLLPASQAGADSSVKTPVSAEAWYRPLPVPLPDLPCAPAAGCVVPPVVLPAANPYPAQTLHVGASGGAEEARTYVSLDTASLPFGVEVAGGTLVLPVLADPTAGTLAPETAEIQVCPATAAVQDGVEGSVGGAPGVDCTTASTAKFSPASGATPAKFTVDLKPFAAGIAAGISSFGVLPVVEAGDAATWHVAFSRRDREGGAPIAAELLVAGSDSGEDVGTDLPPVVDAGSGDSGEPPSFDTGSLGSGTTPDLGIDSPPLTAPQTPLAPEVSPEVPAPDTVVPVAAEFDGPLEYTPLFLLPLLLAAGVFWVGRAYTRDLSRART